jgi:hypothetical protein
MVIARGVEERVATTGGPRHSERQLIVRVAHGPHKEFFSSGCAATTSTSAQSNAGCLYEVCSHRLMLDSSEGLMSCRKPT